MKSSNYVVCIQELSKILYLGTICRDILKILKESLQETITIHEETEYSIVREDEQKVVENEESVIENDVIQSFPLGRQAYRVPLEGRWAKVFKRGR